jgi:hypothetical protein
MKKFLSATIATALVLLFGLCGGAYAQGGKKLLLAKRAKTVVGKRRNKQNPGAVPSDTGKTESSPSSPPQSEANRPTPAAASVVNQ